MRCEYKACPMQAIAGSHFCANHQPQPIKQGVAAEEDVSIVSLESIPAARANEVAMSLLSTLKTLGEGKALKVKLIKFSKPTIMTTQRYALRTGLRIGIRFIGSYGYLWRMTPEQVKAAEEKGARLAKGCAGKKR